MSAVTGPDRVKNATPRVFRPLRRAHHCGSLEPPPPRSANGRPAPYAISSLYEPNIPPSLGWHATPPQSTGAPHDGAASGMNGARSVQPAIARFVRYGSTVVCLRTCGPDYSGAVETFRTRARGILGRESCWIV